MMIRAMITHGYSPPPLLLGKPSAVKGVSKSVTASQEAGIPLTPEQVAVIKAAIKKQQEAQEGGEAPTEEALRFVQGIKPSETLDEMDAKPKRTASRKKKGITLRTTGTVRESDAQKKLERQEKASKKAQKRAAFKQAAQEQSSSIQLTTAATAAPATVVAMTVATADPSADPTIEVTWLQRVSRHETEEVKVKRTVAYEQWFDDNKPEGHGFHAIRPRVEGNYHVVPVVQKASTTLADGTVVTLDYYERVWTRVPVGVSEVQRERGVSNIHRSMFSRQEKKPKAVRSLVLSRMQDKLLGRGKAAVDSKGSVVAEVPWKTNTQPANDPMIVEDTGAIDYDDPGRMARIRHRAYIGRYCRTIPVVTLRRVPGLPLTSRASIRKSFRSTLAARKVRDYDFFESGDYVARLQTNLLRNSTVAYLKDLQSGKPQQLFYSVKQVQDEVGLVEQVARLEAFNDSIEGKKLLTASDIQQAVFNASHYRPDLRTKNQRTRQEAAERKAGEDALTKEWVKHNISERKLWEEQESKEYLQLVLSWAEENQTRNEMLDNELQDTARYDAWLEKHALFNHKDNELYDRWLMKHAAGNLLSAGRLMMKEDDWKYQGWLYDNASDKYRLDQWLYNNTTHRGDNVIDMMEWRHANRKASRVTDHKASVKIGNTTPVKLNLPAKSNEICVYDSIIREHLVATDVKRDKQVTSFGKVTHDIRVILDKFNKDKETGLYIPSYLDT
jgi:hypothetical protein